MYTYVHSQKNISLEILEGACPPPPPPNPPAACDSLLHDDSKFCVEDEQKPRGEILQDRVRLFLLEVCK